MIFLLLFIFCLLLPGFFFSNYLRNKNLIAGILTSLFAIPWITFSIAWLMDITISLKHIVIISTCINLILFLKLKQNLKFRFSKEKKILSLIFSIIFLVTFFTFNGPATDYWSTYIVSATMFMNNDKVDFIDVNGDRLYDYELSGSLRENLVNEQYGVITKDQRIGAPILFTVPYNIMGLEGFRTYFSLIIALSSVLMYYVLREIVHNKYASYLGTLIFGLNPLIIYFNRLNANIISYALIILVIYYLIKKENIIVVGTLFGILGGIRNIAIFFIPAITYLIFINYRKNFIKKIIYFGLGALIFIIPILIWNSFAFGNFLAHPTQFEGLYGHRPTFEHSIFNMDFEFNGMLNYPFIDEIVRTPHYPFPNMISLPLFVIKSFGIILTSTGILGFFYLLKKKKTSAFMVLFSIPFLIFLLLQENWEELKTSFIFLIIPIWIIHISYGIKKILVNKKRVIVLFIISIIIFLPIIGLKNSEFKIDERWEERFPKSKDNYITLENSERKDWQFFHRQETLEEYNYQKKRYLDVKIWPYYEYEKKKFNLRGDLLKYNITTLEVWNYIYG